MSTPIRSIKRRDLDSLLHPTTNLALHRAEREPLAIERGEGIYVWDSDGKQYMEGLAGLWCTALGYGREELVQAAHEQLQRLAYTHLFFGKTHEPAVALAEKLLQSAPFDAAKVFFGNSGSDANDTQIKLVWYYNNAIGRPKKKKIISRQRGYHGVTIGSGSLTGLPIYHRDFDLPIPKILHTDCPYYYRGAEPGETEDEYATRLAESLEQLILREGPDTIAAFIAEPVIGSGGVITPPDTYFEKVQTVLRRYDVLFIDDEVICGFGRTGNMFGAQTYGIQPDTMSLAKALSSAYLPISAVIIPDAMYEPFIDSSRRHGTFGHGFTYTGHPVCAAVALRALELYEELDLYNHARTVGQQFQQRLRSFADHPLVGEARGVGLIGACELVKSKSTKESFDSALNAGLYCADRCQEYGLIVRALGDTIAFCPPLIITDAEVDELFARFGRALDDTHAYVRKSVR